MPDDNKDAERLAQLEAEVAALKAKQPKPQPSFEEMERGAREHMSEVHKMRERNASHVPDWMHRAVGVGVSNLDAWDLAHHGTVQSPSQTRMGSQMPEVRTGSGTGEASRPRPLVPADDAAIDREVSMRLALKNRS